MLADRYKLKKLQQSFLSIKTKIIMCCSGQRQKDLDIIDIAVPVDAGIIEKEKEKVEKYQDLRREVARLWNVKAKVVPIIWLVR